MASLSTCHLELVVWYGNLVKSIVRDTDNNLLFQFPGKYVLTILSEKFSLKLLLLIYFTNVSTQNENMEL